jgi:serine protease AprX
MSKHVYSQLRCAFGRWPVTAFVCALALLAPVPASAGSPPRAFVPRALLQAAQNEPGRTFSVIVQGRQGRSTDVVADDVRAEVAADRGQARGIRRRFASISGVASDLTGSEIVKLAGRPNIRAITQDAPVRLTDLQSTYTSGQLWPYASGVAKYWNPAAVGGLTAPAIAIVDSGVDASGPDLGSRVHPFTVTQQEPNSPGDGRGHGTFVASIAAGEAAGYAGAVPNAQVFSLDVMDDQGMALTSDVVAAADWIYQHKDETGIRVANFSLNGTVPSSFQFDPVDKAVEKLWLSGVVVVAAAGNYAVDGQPSGVRFAPANDPFVITVGATDVVGTRDTSDDVSAPFSAYGYTLDGFAKPDIGAPGRYMVGAVPAASTLALERPDQIVAPGYIQLSGTSFAAPVVAGAAAYLLAAHPLWTPNQVKAALISTADALPAAQPGSSGAGAIDAADAVKLGSPQDGNAPLARFVVPDPSGGPTPVFDAEAWAQAAAADPAWADAYWGSAYWGSAYWGSAYWGSAYWGSAASADAYWGSASVADNADDDKLATGGYWISPEDRAAAEAALWGP